MKISKLRITGLCAGTSPGTGEFPAQMASNAENVSIWWRHHDAERSMHQDFFGINVRHYLANEDICDTYHDHTVVNRIIDVLIHVWEGNISANKPGCKHVLFIIGEHINRTVTQTIASSSRKLFCVCQFCGMWIKVLQPNVNYLM